MTRGQSSNPQWGKIAWTEINTTREWESDSTDSSVGSLSGSRLPQQGTAEWRAIQKSHPLVMLTLLSPYQTPCQSCAVIHLLQNNSFALCVLSSLSSPWQKGTKAPQAAGKIHTDFEKGFIMAEVMKFQDFKEEGSENAVKVSRQGVWVEMRASLLWSVELTVTTQLQLQAALHLYSGEEITAHTPAPLLTSQLILVLNTAILLQLCISLSQCVLTGSR